jgi:hypothetical protein
MIYAKHDFTKNFVNAIGYDDNRMISDMVRDELARLIVEDKKDVVKLLRDENINVKIGDNDSILANYITREIANGNKNFTIKISKMIAKRRVDPATIVALANENKIKNADTTEKTTFWQKVGSFLSNEKVQEAAATIISSALEKDYNKTLGEQTADNEAALQERLKINQMYAQQSRSKTWMIVGIVGGVLIVGTIVT